MWVWRWLQMILAGDRCGAGHVYTIYAPKRWTCSRLPTRSQWLLLCTGKVYNVACSIYGCLFCCIPSCRFCAALIVTPEYGRTREPCVQREVSGYHMVYAQELEFLYYFSVLDIIPTAFAVL